MLIVGCLLGGTVGVATTLLFAAFIGPLVKPALAGAWRSGPQASL